MDWVIFASLSVASVFHERKILQKEKPSFVLIVDKDNEAIQKANTYHDSSTAWYRASFVLVMHEPPHMFYEPKEWSNTTVLLLQEQQFEGNTLLKLPGGNVNHGETNEQSAIRCLRKRHGIDVHSSENCLHHLFTFPLEFDSTSICDFAGVWGDFYECTARGPILQNTPLLSRLSLTEIKHLTDTDPGQFCEVSLYALRLYFQRQGDLRAKRRLMKGYSSADLERYGLRSSSSLEKLVLTDMEDSQRQQAIAYTMKTDDGMTPNLLYKADVVLLGVSRAGKTPLSIFMAQTLGLKVANVPLVMELPPPSQLEKVNPRKIFCLTLQPDCLANFRRSRFQREMKRHVGQRCSYADLEYVNRDVENARSLARSRGYTEIDVTGRAMEETSSLIVSKLQERFPELQFT